MADFFRYNVKKNNEAAALWEEVDAVENYIYILNVRFSGEIHFTKEVDEAVLDCKVPSMMLQPIVENAVTHGIHNIEWEGCISLHIEKRRQKISASASGTMGRGLPESVLSRLERVKYRKELLPELD